MIFILNKRIAAAFWPTQFNLFVVTNMLKLIIRHCRNKTIAFRRINKRLISISFPKAEHEFHW